ncbi:MAG: DUF1122 family protein [Chloroflexi bacterium]|nr:DUF1122 family protein [Chloroflexota bacterium]
MEKPPTNPADLQRLAALARQGFAPPAAEHPFARLHGASLGQSTLAVLLGPTNRVGAHYFQAYLLDPEQGFSQDPILTGLHHRGRYPATNWVEVMALATEARSPDGQAVAVDETEIFRLLVALLPPGGHLMCEYESPQRAETMQALNQGAPPVLTPLGAAMFNAGCTAGFKDWYISEGWTEGPRKLQGFKPLGEEHWREGSEAMAREVLGFLSSQAGQRYLAASPDAAARARTALAGLPLREIGLQEEVRGVLQRLGRG